MVDISIYDKNPFCGLYGDTETIGKVASYLLKNDLMSKLVRY